MNKKDYTVIFVGGSQVNVSAFNADEATILAQAKRIEAGASIQVLKVELNGRDRKKYPLTPYSEQWGMKALELRAAFAPGAYPCKKCGAPVLSGYCCTYCGDSNPSVKDDDSD